MSQFLKLIWYKNVVLKYNKDIMYRYKNYVGILLFTINNSFHFGFKSKKMFILTSIMICYV